LSQLEITNLHKTFGGEKVLQGLSLSMEKGAVYGLIGTNGSGKTTLFNIINGFLAADKGSIFINQTRVCRLSVHERASRGVGRTFQDLRLSLDQTVRDNIILNTPSIPRQTWLSGCLPLKNTIRQQINSNAENVASEYTLGDHVNNLATDLSYGQQKLLTLACVATSNANLLLLDEPVSGISPIIKKTVTSIIQKLRSQGKTLLVIDHDSEFLEDVCDHFFFLTNGLVQSFQDYTTLRENQMVREAYV